MPPQEKMDPVIQQFRSRIAEAAVSKTPLRIRGGGSKDWYGQNLQGSLLDTRACSGIVAYDPTELVITARCGTPLAEIEAKLAQHNQMLPFEPPQFGADSTIGGVVASGLSGPRRQAVGALRDFVLGVVLMDGKGEILRFGGQVMKNVAGYDVSRLLAGSLGVLGLILEVSLKVLPRPLFETTLRFAMRKTEAIEQLNRWGGQPLPISGSAWHGGMLIVRLSGSEPGVNAAARKMGGEVLADADAFWRDLRNQTNEFFTATSEADPLWRLSIPSHMPPLALKGEQLIEWGGAQRWLRTDVDATTIRSIVQQVGGHATLFRGGDKSAGVFHPLAPAVAAIHGNLKNTFDPAGIFNPGRMYDRF
jgi:glycolate oxidase FAD binding subunit